jgi:beta subunit of N-acylethanolamine-hydrolyzing acid amidase
MHYRGGQIPPVYQIDLSLPPASRYVALAEEYRDELRGLMPLFDDLLYDIGIPLSLFPLVRRFAQLVLRRMYSSEESLELHGISQVTQVPIYLLVSFNVILDLLMGCTSGAVRSLEKGQPLSDSKMLHFRTLDWGMDTLRRVIVQLEFVRSASKTPNKVLATTLTYVGYVGVVTGVRPGLSVSLNFRPQHNTSLRIDHVRFYAHNLLVLLGKRQSISSLLRNYLFSDGDQILPQPFGLENLAEMLPSQPSTAAYLIFCDGRSAMTIEKDRITGVIRRSNSFIAITNHDLEDNAEIGYGSSTKKSRTATTMKKSNTPSLLERIIAESVDRRNCLFTKWTHKVNEARKRSAAKSRTSPLSVEETMTVTSSELRRWLTDWPTVNECTHLAAILDPTEGKVHWTRRYPDPIEAPPSAQLRAVFASEQQ